MKIAYVTTYDASNVRKWSGLGHDIAQALEQARVRRTSSARGSHVSLSQLDTIP
jgi:hypothetical protein